MHIPGTQKKGDPPFSKENLQGSILIVHSAIISLITVCKRVYVKIVIFIKLVFSHFYWLALNF